MADITVTASSVVPGANAVIARGTSGGNGANPVTAGMSVYADPASNPVGLIKPAAQTSATTVAVVGIALNAGSANQPIEYQTSGDITMTTTPALVPGRIYVLGSGAGGISDSADLNSAGAGTRYGTILAVALTPTSLRLGITHRGVLRA